MTNTVLIGGGGHAMSCLDACDNGTVRLVGYVAQVADENLPLRYLGRDQDLPGIRRSGVEQAFVAVGDNERRRSLSERAVEIGFRLATICASSARVSPHATVQPGAALLHGALVGPRTRIGIGAIINTAASVDHDCIVGDFAHLAPGTHVAGNVRIGAGVFAGVGVSVIPGVRVGDRSVVGAGAVVIDDIAALTTVMGAPARPRRVS